MKQVKDFHIIESTETDVAVVFYYTDGTKEIFVIDKAGLRPVLEELKGRMKETN